MEIDKIIQHWLATAADDLAAAEHLLQSGDYVHALFFAHLYLEKVLKARVVQEIGEHAPFTHNLRYLAERGRLSLTSEQAAFLARVTEYSTSVRYPDMQSDFKRRCTQDFCANELVRIKEFGTWVKKMMS